MWSPETIEDYRVFAEAHVKLHGKKVSDGLYRLKKMYLNEELVSILDGGQVPWILKGAFLYVTIR